MRKFLAISGLLVVSAVACAGQSDPEKYAGELSKLLAEYQKQLSNKLNAEQQAYTAAAKLYDDAFRENAFASLELDRTIDAQQVERALRGATLTPDKLMDDVYAYAQDDFAKTRAVYLLGIDSYRTYLSNLNTLEADSQKVSALVKMLNDLAKPAGLRVRLMEIQTYQKDFNEQLHFSDCSLAASILAVNAGKKAAVDKQLETVTGQIATAGPEVDVSRRQMSKSALDQQSKSLQMEIDRVRSRRDNSGGFTPGSDSQPGKCEVK